MSTPQQPQNEPPQSAPRVCVACGAQETATRVLRRCAACKDDGVVYCGRSCQRASWAAHKAQCLMTRKARAAEVLREYAMLDERMLTGAERAYFALTLVLHRAAVVSSAAALRLPSAFCRHAVLSSKLLARMDASVEIDFKRAFWTATLGGARALGSWYDALCTGCLLYTSPSPRDRTISRMPSSA